MDTIEPGWVKALNTSIYEDKTSALLVFGFSDQQLF
jgi:hypothetical protein